MKRFLLSTLLALSFLLPRQAAALDRIVELLAVGVTDNGGAVLRSGTVTVYDAGTTNLRTVYSDFALTVPASNPLTLDVAGRAVVYTDRRVKLLIKSRTGSTVRTVDNVGTADSDIGAATATALAGSGLTAPGDGTLTIDTDSVSTSLSSLKLRVTPGYTGAGEFSNASIAASVAANALTLALKTNAGTDPAVATPVNISFRSSTLTSGAYVSRTVVGAISTIISSGSTAGHTSATEWPLYVYALDNAGTVELAWSTSPLDERLLQSTTAEGGAGAADSPAVFYSTTARTSVAVRLLAVLKSTQTTAGTWAAVPTAISAPTQPGAIGIGSLRPSATTIGIAGEGLSATSSTTTTVSSTGAWTDISPLSITLTTSGRPVFVGVKPDGNQSNNQAALNIVGGAASSPEAYFRIVRGSTSVAETTGKLSGLNASNLRLPVGALWTIDEVAAGTYTYKLQAWLVSASGSVGVLYSKLVAYEL